jgi:hypothetical protein
MIKVRKNLLNFPKVQRKTNPKRSEVMFIISINLKLFIFEFRSKAGWEEVKRQIHKSILIMILILSNNL